MENTLADKILLLTGGGGGIGRAIALRMAREGMKIILLGGSDLKKLEDTKALVEEFSPCTALPGDLTDLSFLEKAAVQAAEVYGGIDVLINNAGAAANHAFENVTAAEFDKIMAINVKVPFFLTQFALPFLKNGHQYRFSSRPCRISAAKCLHCFQACPARYDKKYRAGAVQRKYPRPRHFSRRSLYRYGENIPTGSFSGRNDHAGRYC